MVAVASGSDPNDSSQRAARNQPLARTNDRAHGCGMRPVQSAPSTPFGLGVIEPDVVSVSDANAALLTLALAQTTLVS